MKKVKNSDLDYSIEQKFLQGNTTNNNSTGSGGTGRKQKDRQERSGEIFYQRLKKFYMKDFHGLIHTYKRSKPLSIFIIVIIEMQTISLSFYRNISDSYELLKYISYFRFYPLFISETSELNAYSIALYSFLATIVFSIVVTLILFIDRIFKIKINKTIKNTLIYMASFANRVLLQIMLIPSFEMFFRIADNFTSNSTLLLINYVNFILYIAWSIGYFLHNFEYTFKLKDFMANREGYWSFNLIIYYVTISVIYNSTLTWEIPMINFIFSLIRCVEQFSEMNYYEEIIDQIACVSRSVTTTISFLVFIYTNVNEDILPGKLELLLLIIPPIIGRLAIQVRYYIIHKFTSNRESSKRLQIFGMKINFLLKYSSLDYEDYLKKGNGIYFESFFSNHINKCEKEDCFCHSFQKDYSINELLSSKLRQRFMQFFTVQFFHEYFEQKFSGHADKRAMFMFIAYLVEVVGIPTKAMVEIMQMKQNYSNYSLKEQYTLESLYFKALNKFENVFQQNGNQSQRLEMMSVIDFDDLLFRTNKAVRYILNLAKDYLTYLSNDYFMLSNLQEKGQILIKLREYINRKFHILFEINPFSKQLYFIASIFLDNFNFKGVKISSFINKGNLLIFSKLSKEDLTFNLFRPNSCIVFISLLQPIGTIRRMTASAETMFQRKRQTLLGINCKILMPNLIAKQHDLFLQTFIERGLSAQNQENSQQIVFGRYPNGFIFPLTKRIKIDSYQGTDFGVCAFFEHIERASEYFLCNRKGAIHGMTEKLYKETLENALISQYDKIELYDIGRLIPLINCLISDNMVDQQDLEMTTMMIIPKDDKRAVFFRKYKNSPKDMIEQFIGNIDKYENDLMFFEVTVRVMRHQTSISRLSYFYVEIAKMKKIKSDYERQEMMNIMKKELNMIYGTHMRVRKSIYLAGTSSSNNNNNAEFAKSSFGLNNQFHNDDLLKNIANLKNNRNSQGQYVKNRGQNDDQTSQAESDGHSMARSGQDMRGTQDEQNMLAYKTNYSNFTRNLDSSTPYPDKETFSSQNTQKVLEILQSKSAGQKNQIDTLHNDKIPTIESSPNRSQGEIINYEKNQTDQFNLEAKVTGIQQNGIIQQKFYNGGMEIQQNEEIIPSQTSRFYARESDVRILQDNNNFAGNTINNHNNQLLLTEEERAERQFQNQKSTQESKLIPSTTESKSGAALLLAYMMNKTHIQGSLNNINPNDASLQQSHLLQMQFQTELLDSNQSLQFPQNHSASFLQSNQALRTKASALEINDMLDPDEKIPRQFYKTMPEEYALMGKPKNSSVPIDQSLNIHRLLNNSTSLNDESKYNNNLTTPFGVRGGATQLRQVQEDDNENQSPKQSDKDRAAQDINRTDSRVKSKRDNISTDNIEENNNFNEIKNSGGDAQSIHSSKTSSQSSRMTIIEAIYSNKPPFLIQGITWFGVFAYGFLNVLTIVIFISLLQEFDSEISNFKQMMIPPLLGSFFSQTIADKEFVRLGATMNVFSYNATMVQLIIDNYSDSAQMSVNNYRNTLGTAMFGYNITTSSTTFSQNINDEYVKIITIDAFYSEKETTISLNLALIDMSYHLLYYAVMEAIESLIFIIENTFVFLYEFTQLQKISFSAANENLQSVQNLLVETLIIIEIMTLIVVFTVFPIYIIVIKAQERVLKLMGTFHQDKLNTLLDRIEDSTNAILTKDKFLSSGKSIKVKIRGQQKRRTTSQTDTLSQVSIPLIIFAILTFLLISLYPVFNMVFTYQYTKQFENNLSEIKNIYEAKKQFISLYAATFSSMTRVILTQNVDPKLYTNLSKIVDLNESTIQGLQASQATLQTSRSNMGDYCSILLAMLEDNACTAVTRFIDQISDDSIFKSKFNVNDCTSANGGTLTRGLVVALPYLLSSLANAVQAFKAADINDFLTFLQASDIGLYEFQMITLSLTNVVELAKEYMVDTGKSFFEYLQSLQVYFFIYCEIVLLLVFLLGWTYFVLKMKDNLHQSKHLMSLFPLEFLIDNPYVMSHINTELMKYKDSK